MKKLKKLTRNRVREFPNHFDEYQEPWNNFPHVISIKQFSRPLVERLIFQDTMKTLFHLLNRSLISYLHGSETTVVMYFFEPSTRTRMSFERGAQLLGARIIHSEAGGLFSSAAKNESMPDTTRTVSGVGLGIGYGDIIVVRHPRDGVMAQEIALYSRKPVISAGEGKTEHPTQAFLDLATFYLHNPVIDGMSIAFIGDNRYSRTVRSNCYLLSLFDRIKIYFVQPEELRPDPELRRFLDERGVWYREETDLKKVVPHTRVNYSTRLQIERFKESDPGLYNQLEKRLPNYDITPNILDLVPKDSIISHPLPIGKQEINEVVKRDPRVWAFIQTDVGIATRMSIINRICKELAKQKMHHDFKQTVFGNLGWL